MYLKCKQMICCNALPNISHFINVQSDSGSSLPVWTPVIEDAITAAVEQEP
jgi:hypothetical protein